MKTILEKHREAVEKANYSGTTTHFDGYIQFDTIHDSQHGLMGFTVEYVKKCVEMLKNPNYAYARQKSGYINIYVRSQKSPTGVELLGGIPDELEFLLGAFDKTGQLSPTEDLRTAH